MLNVGVLGQGASNYYAGVVATSAEDYYTGKGESPGRWVGSLAIEMGLVGTVDLDDFRAVLAGRDPRTNEYLISAQGNAARAATRRRRRASSPRLDEEVDVLRAAAHLGVSGQYVRLVLKEGDEYRKRLGETAETDAKAPSAYLCGRKVPRDGMPGEGWVVSRGELERFSRSRHQTKSRPGYDLTLRPPKSVSVLWALADDERRAAIRQAHCEAVDEVVRYYEKAAVRARDGQHGRRLVDTVGMVAAAFDHRTSRAGDPLLHTHVVTANFTRVLRHGQEGEWRAIASPALFEHAKTAGYLYQAHLRHLLTSRLGVEFTPVRNGYADVVGVPEPVLRLFSKRRVEIGEMLSESGHTSARAAQIATLQTRQVKHYGVSPDTVHEQWRCEANAAGFNQSDVNACFGRATARSIDAEQEALLLASLGGPYGITERAATFNRSDVIEAVASAVGSSAPAQRVEELADLFLASPRVLVVDRIATVEMADSDQEPQRSPQRVWVRGSNTQKLYTTPELARLEEQLLGWGSASTRSGVIVDDETVAQVIRERPELSFEQRTMIRAACTATELIQPISGCPGAGKTYATEAVVAAHIAAGVAIIGCAVSATAAGELERSAGFARSTGAPATTVARLLLDLDGPYGALRPGTVIVVDEASMIATRDLARLVSAVLAVGGTLKLIGDPHQHGSVDVGGVFRRLCADRGDGLVVLVENKRQRNHVERLAVVDYREGRVTDALARYDDAGKIVRSPTAGESFDAIVADWYAARLHGGADPMIAGPNSTRRALNERARALLKANGELVGPALVVAGREFMVGDEVVARRNDRTLHGENSRDFVKNGAAGIIGAIDTKRDDVIVDFDREGTIAIPGRYLAAGHLEHGYARTTYGVQGATHDVARYHPTDVSSFEEGYVAITRARTAARIYIVDGTLPGPDDDLSHAPDEPQRFGLSEIAEALARRRSSHMAADAAADLAAVAATLQDRTLAELTARRRQLGRILAGAPAATSEVIAETQRTLDAIRARRNAWTITSQEASATLTANPDSTDADSPESARVRKTITRADGAIASLDRIETRTEHKLEAARRQQAERNVWLDAHADIVAEYPLAYRAERARETQVRVAAAHRVPRELASLIGPEPALQRDRHTWRAGVEAAAVYRDRYAIEPSHATGMGAVLGACPDDRLAAAHYNEAVAAISAACAVAADTAVVAEL